MKEKTEYKILVVIVTYNAMQWAERCFDSLRKSTIVPDVFVVDNGSTDGTQQFIQKNYPEVRFTQSEENLGFGKANNIGLQYALDNNYDYVYLLNQDAWVMPDTFEKLIKVSKCHPEYGVLSPMQMQADIKHFERRFFLYVISCNQRTEPFFVEDLFFDRQKSVYEVSFVMAAHWLISHKCLEIVGGFSPTFPHYGEDNNYLHRVWYWKMKIGIVPNSFAIHDRSNTEWSKEKADYIDNYISTLQNVSNPLATINVTRYVIGKSMKAILKWDWTMWNYTFKVFKKRKQIKKNFQKSLIVKAFLK